MSTPYLYPVFLKLQGRPVLIIGGGAQAWQKACSLEGSGANLTVVAPRACPALAQADRAGRLAWLPRPFRSEDVATAKLVFAATDDPALNARVAAEARARGILANAVDQPDHCDFYTPAIVRHPVVTLALSTGGAFPGLARALRKALEALLPTQDAELHRPLLALRTDLRRRLGPEQRREALRELLDGITRRYLLPGGAGGSEGSQNGGSGEAAPFPRQAAGTSSAGRV
jgi:siroheme synthase-like protein